MADNDPSPEGVSLRMSSRYLPSLETRFSGGGGARGKREPGTH